jgi:hypothetical protein
MNLAILQSGWSIHHEILTNMISKVPESHQSNYNDWDTCDTINSEDD